MLSVVGHTLRTQGPLTAVELARRIGADETAVLGMLDLWCRKGKVARERLACGGCTACDVTSTECYRWDEDLHLTPSRTGTSACP